MDNRSFESGASATPPTPPASPSVGYPQKGNPATGTAATKPGPYYYHQTGEELRNLIIAGGLTPSNTDLTQVLQAVQQLIVNGGATKMPVRAATTANITTLAGGAPNTLDGITLAANDRILVKDQSTGSQNGIYVVTTLGSGANGTWTRAADADVSAEVMPGMMVVVAEGTVNADTEWELSTNGPITLGTTALAFQRFVSTADFGSSLATSGYQKLPSGLIVQWGSYAGGVNNPTISLPIAFPIACQIVIASSFIVGASQTEVPVITAKTTSSFNAKQLASGVGATTNPFLWFAIGY